MKSLQRQQSIPTLQNQLDQYLTLKPHRAVQRLLQQNNLPQCFEIYNLLQYFFQQKRQNVKSNTTQLRSVLYSKHENLHQCSQMILQIQDFAQKVKKIQTSIDELMKTEVIEEDYGLTNSNYDNNPISKVQDLMNDNKYTQALKECGRYVRNDSININQSSQLYYINFLKVEVVQKLQEHLQNNPLTSELIQQSINALKQFMIISTIQDLFEYIQQSAPSQSQQVLYINNQSQTLIRLIYQKYAENEQNQKKYPLQQEQIVQVIFKFKLLTLKKSTQNHSLHKDNPDQEKRVDFLYSKVFYYFSDLLKILEQVSYITTQNNFGVNHKPSNSKLYQIFSSNIHKIIEQISQIFITDKRKICSNNSEQIKKQLQNLPTLTFENELYEKLINSQDFIEVINSLQKHFTLSSSKNENETQDYEILGLIKNLWRDFYHQMLDIITQKINPCCYFKFQHSFIAQPMEQFMRFSVIPFQKITKQKIQNYQKQLHLFFSNFVQLLNKSKSTQQKNSIIQYFLQLKRKIDQLTKEQVLKLNDDLQKYESKNSKYYSSRKKLQLKIRQIIVLFFLIRSYNNSWINNVQQNQQLSRLLIDSNSQRIEKNIFEIEIFSNIQNAQSQFDHFYQIFDKYINTQISHRQLSSSEYIQRWQHQFDQIFGSYNLIAKENQYLKSNLKQLILALIKTKLQHLQKS